MCFLHINQWIPSDRSFLFSVEVQLNVQLKIQLEVQLKVQLAIVIWLLEVTVNSLNEKKWRTSWQSVLLLMTVRGSFMNLLIVKFPRKTTTVRPHTSGQKFVITLVTFLFQPSFLYNEFKRSIFLQLGFFWEKGAWRDIRDRSRHSVWKCMIIL